MKALKSLEPKQQKTFRDKYLAVVFAVAALLISSIATAQLDSAKYSPINGYGFKYKRMVFDSVLMIPRSTSPHTPWRAGAIRYNAPDSTLQLWTGNQWNSILTGIGNGVDTAYMINDTLLLIETPDQNFMLAIPGRPRVDSIYRKAGQDSIYYSKNGVEYALKDSAGGEGGSSLDTTTIYQNINLKLNKLDTVTYETVGSDTLVYIGTSITVGTGTTSTQFRYSTWATRFLKRYGYGFKEWNLGASGSQLTHQIGNIPLKRPGLRLLVIEFGTNELNTSVDSATYRTNQITFIDTCIARGWSVSELAIISQMGSQYGAVGTVAQQRGMNFVDSTNCLSYGINYIDAWNPELTPGYTYIIQNPDIHPSDEQAMVLGEIVAGSISKMIQYNNEGNELVLDGRAQFGNAVIKNRKFIAAPQLLGIDSTGNVGVTTTLPANISTQGEMIMRGGLVLQGYGQRAEATQRNLTDYNSALDLYLGKGSRIIQNVGGFQSTLIPMATNGFASWGSNFSGGLNLDFQQTNINGPVLITGRIEVGTNSYIQSAQGGDVSGNRIFTSEGGTGDMIFKNRISVGSTYWTMSKGVNGTEDMVMKLFPSGSLVKQSSGTLNEVGVSEFTVNSTTKGILIPRMSGSQRNAITVGKISGVSISNAGSGYTDGGYTNVTVSGGSGTGATFGVNIASGVITAVTLMNSGTGYLVGDVLSITTADVGGTGSGATITVTAVQEDGLLIFNNETHKPNWYNGVTGWQVPADSASAGGSTYTFINGLTESGGTAKLGGTLTQNTTIDGSSSYTTTYTGSRTSTNSSLIAENTSSGRGLTATSSTGIGVYGTGAVGLLGLSSSGTGVWAESTTGQAFYALSPYTDGAGVFISNPSSTNTTHTVLNLTRLSTSAGANNIAGALDFNINNTTAAGSVTTANRLISKLTTATSGSEVSQFEIWGVNSGSSAKKFSIAGNGQITADGYGSGTHTVTPATTPVYSSSGVIGERIAPKIYTALLSQSGTSDPTATILGTNEIGAIIWTRNSTGNYTGTLTGAFTNNKTWLICQKGDGTGSFVNALLSRNSDNALTLDVRDNANSVTDSFTNLSIEIRVYP
jgi:hypothetical protein